MMPPSAKAKGTHSGDATPTGVTNWSTAYQPIFSTGTVDYSQAEVAKTFHWREFGNGAANGGSSSSYKDASFLVNNGNNSTSTDFGYTMDDGLTGMTGEDCTARDDYTFMPVTASDWYMITFIGTGIGSWAKHATAFDDRNAYAQNLPYGTHILKVFRGGSDVMTVTIDGVSLGDNANGLYGSTTEFDFYQPKMPPIPENAVILADYMLMADFVGVTAGTSGGIEVISKGTRFLTATRDILWDENTNDGYGFTFGSPNSRGGNYQSMNSGNISSGEAFGKVPYFGTTVDVLPYADRFNALTEPLNSTSITTTSVSTTTWSGRQRASGQTLGRNEIKVNQTSGNITVMGFEIATPIHTSSHYQTFETPFLHELVGGDRNMEQTNLVVTADGKTWDEVTRDTSYIGNELVNASITTSNITSSWTDVRWDEWRGLTQKINYGNKDWAIAYDSVVCLKDGAYYFQLHISCQSSVGGAALWFAKADGNNSYEEFLEMKHTAGDKNPIVGSRIINCHRGDTIKARGLETNFTSIKFSNFLIMKV